MGQATEQIVLYDDLEYIRRQYLLRHYVTGTINGSMNDTYNRMALLLSDTEILFSLWNRGQLFYFIAHQDHEQYYFYWSKKLTISGLKLLLNQRTHWRDYIE